MVAAQPYPWLEDQDPCSKCGLCCLVFWVPVVGGDVPRVEPHHRQPQGYKDRGGPHLRRVDTGECVPVLEGGNQKEGRCMMLAGVVGEQVYCTHHTPRGRPLVCRNFVPGCRSCNDIRRAYGVDELPEAPLSAYVAVNDPSVEPYLRDCQKPLSLGRCGSLRSPYEPGPQDWVRWLWRRVKASCIHWRFHCSFRRWLRLFLSYRWRWRMWRFQRSGKLELETEECLIVPRIPPDAS